MKLGYQEKIITPNFNAELVGFVPSRISEGVEKDLKVKVITLENNNKYYSWLVCDTLGLDLFFKEKVIQALKTNNLILEDLQIFATHTHSAPRCLNKTQYYDKNVDTDLKNYFDYMVKQATLAILESVNNQAEFTYKTVRGKLNDFQSNRHNINDYYDSDILLIEVSIKDKKILLYSFGGHPTILDRDSKLISPDYVGEVSKLLSSKYKFNMFINAPCGDISSRFTRVDNGLDEMKRLANIVFIQIEALLSKLSESKELENYRVKHLAYDVKYKEFDSVELANKKYLAAKAKYEENLANNLDKNTLRLLKSKVEGNLINLSLSKREINEKYLTVNIFIVYLDDYVIVNLPSEIFSSLTKPLKKENIWINSLSDQYNTYLCDSKAYENNTYEAISSLYAANEGEKLIEFTLENI